VLCFAIKKTECMWSDYLLDLAGQADLPKDNLKIWRYRYTQSRPCQVLMVRSPVPEQGSLPPFSPARRSLLLHAKQEPNIVTMQRSTVCCPHELLVSADLITSLKRSLMPNALLNYITHLHWCRIVGLTQSPRRSLVTFSAIILDAAHGLCFCSTRN
jgi:hypothetical protein